MALSLAAFALLSLALVALAGCSSSSGNESDPSPSASAAIGSALEGRVWKATEIAGTSVVSEDAQVTAEFNAGTLSGSGGVNSYTASYTVSDPAGITIGQPAATMMAGPEKLMNQEAAYFAALTEATTFVVADDVLTLSNDAGDVVVRYEVLEPAASDGAE